MGDRPEKKGIPAALKWVIASAPPALAIVLFVFFSRSRELANNAVRRFSRPAKDILGTVCSLIPFSVMELMYVALGVFLIVYIVLSVIRVVRDGRKLITALKRTGVLLLTVLYIFSAYLWLLGIDYHADSFADKSSISVSPVSVEELKTVTAYFVKNASQLAGTVQRDEDGHYAEDLDSVLSRSTSIYDELSEEFPFLSCTSRVPKKMLLFSKLSSFMGFTGVYFPFTGESNINIDAPGCLIPFTIAHELAHQRSIYAEQEANFLGVAACLSSGDTVYTYSGFLSGSIYLMNALYRADKESWRELSAEITGFMRTDWQDNSAYWDQFETKVTEVSESVYDSFLKVQGQELGMQSYGACVDLLTAYFYPLCAEE